MVKVEFDKSVIFLEEILRIFFAMHDPTKLNQQGNDIGTQYRSIILYKDKNQHDTAENILREIAESKVYGDLMLVTELKQFEKFHAAEQYHWNYYEKHPEQGYCQLLITPKLVKFRSEFKPFFKELI
ncbi:MAG: hypothetical protein ACD_5C00253G0001 [uncultured bacterium]|nr:MAG: hypothetical protein ACD_5C00253G0001 [uncultured bacterium]